MVKSKRERTVDDLRMYAGMLGRTARDYWGTQPRECNLCGYRGKFRTFGSPGRADARCPQCGSVERHRLLGLFAEEDRTFEGRDVLHFAPEPSVSALIRGQRPSSYDVSDFGNDATLNLNLEDIRLPDCSYDVVVASHVMEHVDDSKAMREVYRILRPSGVALVMVPIIEGWQTTYENGAVKTPIQRTVHFGQFDHVRYYGADIRQRLQDAGFTLTEITATEPDVFRYGLQRGEKIFVCQRP